MNLTVRIHDKEYINKVAQGVTFSEEYNETLDSGVVRLGHIEGQIEGLKPYDDVYIYESAPTPEEEADWFDNNIATWRKGGKLHDGNEVDKTTGKRIPFYRHLLVDKFTEEVINLSEGIFSYTIEMFSETKGLETVQCPNISVTQPLVVSKKIDIYTYLERFVKLYSPKYKKSVVFKDETEGTNVYSWEYAQKYTIAPELKGIFSGFYSQDFSLSNPNLRDILSTLMVTLDMIPYVKDNVIYAKDISKRTGTYNMSDEQKEGRISRIVGQMGSSDFCDGVRRQYSDALSSEGTCHFVEYLGFRNKNNALMTLENMELETTHKIYQIKKLYLCYYRDVITYDENGHAISENSRMLCKQDMTPLVKTEQEWNVLSQDWRELGNAPKTVEDYSKYKISTVYYSIGGKAIKGWGTHYKEIESAGLAVYDITKTYIENIVNILDTQNRIGNGDLDFDDYKNYYFNNIRQDKTLAYIAPLGSAISGIQNLVPSEDTKPQPLKYKTIFFQIEYWGFYDGAIIHSRGNGRDNIISNDNSSSSLTLLEKDGVAQKEKLDRFANKTYVMKGRLDGDNYSVVNLLQLGATGTIGADDDVIIYRREYSIFDNYISASYAGIQDYVLKNFYTSVYAKYRTYQLMSYGESVNRSEAEKVLLLLSKDKIYKSEKDNFFSIKKDSKNIEAREFFSAFIESDKNKNVKTAIIATDKNKIKEFYVDLMSFYCGNIMCFNIAMPDNSSGGNFIYSWGSEYQLLIASPSENSDYYVGSKQQWYNIVDDNETGAIDYMSFGALSENKKIPLLFDWVVPFDKATAEKWDYATALGGLPIANDSTLGDENFSLSTGIKSVYKDNKDRIDMTLQIEPVSDSPNDIVIGSYLIKLSNLLIDDSIKKIETEKETERYGYKTEKIRVDIAFYETAAPSDNEFWIALPENDDFRDETLKFTSSETAAGFSMDIDGDSLGITPLKGARFYFSADKMYKSDNSIIILGSGSYKRMSDSEETLITQIECKFRNYSAFADKDIPLDYKKGYIYQLRAENLFNKFDTMALSGTNLTSLAIMKMQSTTLGKNMFIQFSDTPIDKNFAYKILQYKEITGLVQIPPREIFEVVDEDIDSGNVSKIKVNLKDVPSTTKSISYWYFDFDSEYQKNYGSGNYVYEKTPYRSGYHFVFGVNITEADIERGYIDIYISKTTNRDERVFDEMGRQVGVVHNCINDRDADGNLIVPKYQTYDKIGATSQTFNYDKVVDGKIETKTVTAYVGDTFTAKYDGTQFKSWVIGNERIKTNPYTFVVTEDYHPDVRLSLNMTPPQLIVFRLIPSGSTYGGTLELSIYNPNEVMATFKGTLYGDQNTSLSFTIRDIPAFTQTKTFTFELKETFIIASDSEMKGQLIANDYSISDFN